MRVLVVGSGGREHALVWKILSSPKVTKVYCAPGNGGTATIAENVPIAVDQLDALAAFALTQKIDLTIVGPEFPLTLGIVNCFEDRGLSIVGPSREAARLEGSKIFAKEFMSRHQIPTAAYVACSSAEEALAAIQCSDFGYPLVIKADGLAAGKGVVMVKSQLEAEATVREMMEDRILGKAGERLLLEECLRGEEASFLVFSDGEHILSMEPSQDHKTVFDHDQGPNTGGMGAYSTDQILSAQQHEEIIDTIVRPTIRGMAAERTPFQGILYVGLMLTQQGVKVLEFNVRMGDPETQPVLFRLENDLVEVFQGICGKTLNLITLLWDPACSVCVVLTAGGYPGRFQKGQLIEGLAEAEAIEDVKVFHAGTVLRGGQVMTCGGRVLGVTAKSADLPSAIDRVYQAVQKVKFQHMHYRTDIGSKGLKEGTVETPKIH